MSSKCNDKERAMQSKSGNKEIISVSEELLQSLLPLRLGR